MPLDGVGSATTVPARYLLHVILMRADGAGPVTHACRLSRAITGGCLLGMGLAGAPDMDAQTWTYSNTDAGRPVRTEDASALPRYVLDAYLLPTVLADGGATGARWALRPGLTYGLVPRTQIELSLPFGSAGREGSPGVAGLQLATQYALNTETRTLPALALEAGLLAPLGSSGVARAHPSLKLLVTRSHFWGRVHVNAETSFGDETRDSTRVAARVVDLARWSTGLAVDRSLASQALLVTAEVLARQPLDSGKVVQWRMAAGLRYQLTPTLLLEGGLSGAPGGDAPSVAVSAGVSRATSITALLPGLGRWGRR